MKFYTPPLSRGKKVVSQPALPVNFCALQKLYFITAVNPELSHLSLQHISLEASTAKHAPTTDVKMMDCSDVPWVSGSGY